MRLISGLKLCSFIKPNRINLVNYIKLDELYKEFIMFNITFFKPGSSSNRFDNLRATPYLESFL